MSLPPYDQSIRELERQYQVVLPDSVGQAALAFREGVWFRVNSGAHRPVPIRSAIILCPHAAGSIVQITCWWMRENGRTSRALDLATELSLCVGELARKAVEDDPLGMSLDSLSTSQQNAVSGYPSQPPAAGYGAGSASYGQAPSMGAASPAGGFETSGYGSGAYQTTPDPYQPTAYPAAPVAAAGATTVLPQVPADGYGMPQAQRGPAVPPRGAGGPAGRPMPLGSGGYPQRPAPQQQPLSGQPMRPQQPGGRYPQGQGQGGRPPQQRPMPRPEQQRYEEDMRGDLPGRPPSRPTARPEPGSAW